MVHGGGAAFLLVKFRCVCVRVLHLAQDLVEGYATGGGVTFLFKVLDCKLKRLARISDPI